MKKLLVLTIAIAMFVMLNAGAALAIKMELVPLDQTVALGTQADVALNISGLTEGGAPSLGVFDLDVTYDNSILSFNSVDFVDPVLGSNQLDIMGFGSITWSLVGGAINIQNVGEISLDFADDLDAFQAGSFTMATFTFDTIGQAQVALP
jgi:hypothetical protein